MKMRAKKFLKVAVMLTLTTTLMVSCGQENESGDSNSSGYGYPSMSSSGNGLSLPSDWLNRVQNENPCQTYTGYNTTKKTRITVPLQGTNLNAGAFYVGVTPEGDVGIVSNQGSKGPVMEIYLCARPDLSGQGSLMETPVVNNSRNCPVGEVTKAYISLQSTYGNPYTLSFAPIHIQGTDRQSSMCQSSYY